MTVAVGAGVAFTISCGGGCLACKIAKAMSATEGVDRENSPTTAATPGGSRGFVDFLRTRDDDKRLTQAAAKVAEASIAAVWNNDEDAADDRM